MKIIKRILQVIGVLVALFGIHLAVVAFVIDLDVPDQPFPRDGRPSWRLLKVQPLPHGHMVLCGWQEDDEAYADQCHEQACVLHLIYRWMQQAHPGAMPSGENDVMHALIAGIVVGLGEADDRCLPPHLCTKWARDEAGHWMKR